MPAPLVECIPNFSEARHTEIIEEIIAAIKAVPGIQLLDRHSDLDHNRSVITYVGAPGAVEEAAFQGIAKAAQLVDLNQHEGAHPRIGATDVVPFVPITGVTMQDCVEIARRLGKRVGAELGIPVYLYEEAATRPDRKNLEDIRKGQYEGLKEEILSNPDRKPDFGPAQLGSAGATVIGARQPLIAYNVYLTTTEVPIAQKIAKAIRQSSGGMRYVKSMGILVDGRAQVSINLTNFRQSPIARVVELVRREAQRYGVGIHHTELVGLAPQEALIDAAQWYLQLDQFEPDQILETRLFAAQQATTAQPEAAKEPDFIDQLAAATPTPGGGAASAHTAAEAAALVAMVARLTTGKKKYAEVESQMWTLIEKADALQKSLRACAVEDSAAFEALMAAMKLPRDTGEQQKAREEAIQKATLGAIDVPLKVAAKAVEVLELSVPACELGNLNAISDGGTAATLAGAALTGAGYNVRINTQGLQDQTAAEKFLVELKSLETKAAQLQARVREILNDRGGFKLA